LSEDDDNEGTDYFPIEKKSKMSAKDYEIDQKDDEQIKKI
jgi:hypothetical protein